MRDLLLVIGAGYIGWYLALNKRKEVEQALAKAKKEAKNLAQEVGELSQELSAEIEDNNRLAQSIVTEDVSAKQKQRRGVLLNSFIDEFDY
jgi:ribosomal protein L9